MRAFGSSSLLPKSEDATQLDVVNVYPSPTLGPESTRAFGFTAFGKP